MTPYTYAICMLWEQSSAVAFVNNLVLFATYGSSVSRLFWAACKMQPHSRSKEMTNLQGINAPEDVYMLHNVHHGE